LVQNKAGFGVRIRTKSAPNVQGMFIPTRPATSLSGFSFDDPAVAYQAILPKFSSFKRPNESGNGYVDGALKLDEWTAQDGAKRHGFAGCPGTHVFSKSVAISREA
jgi:hypothetical protein